VGSREGREGTVVGEVRRSLRCTTLMYCAVGRSVGGSVWTQSYNEATLAARYRHIDQHHLAKLYRQNRHCISLQAAIDATRPYQSPMLCIQFTLSAAKPRQSIPDYMQGWDTRDFGPNSVTSRRILDCNAHAHAT